LKENVALLGLLTPVADDNARAVDDLPSVTFTVEHAETSPFTEFLAVGDLNEGDFVLGTQGLDELLVCIFVAVFVENAHVGLTTVEGLGSLTEATGKTVMNEGVAEDALQGILNRHLSLGGGIGGDLDLLGSFDFGDILSCFRHD